MKKLDMGKGSGVWILRGEEAAAQNTDLPQWLKKTLESPRYCKIEKFGESYAGTIRVPRREEEAELTFGFILETGEDRLYFAEDSGKLEEVLEENREALQRAEDGQRFLLGVLHVLLKDDVLLLERMEEGIFSLEEELLKAEPENIQQRTACYRRRLFTLHTYYEQLTNLAENMEDDPQLAGQGDIAAEWGRLADRTERLHDHVEMLREYLLQIRELYQSMVAEKQNRIITLLTVITTIFLPLTLIAGWYGMNFPGMPELHWKYGYLAVIAVSALIVATEIVYFRKKKML